MYFLNRNDHTGPLFKDLGVLKLYDRIAIENCKFINMSLNNELPTVLNNWFTFPSDIHHHNTRTSTKGVLSIPSHCTKLYGRYSVSVNAVYTWNYLQSQHKNILLYKLTTTKLKTILLNFFLNKYY